MDIDSPSYSRWSYATSFARSEPCIPHRQNPQSRTRLVPEPVRPPPPTVSPPALVQTSLGIWEDKDAVYYASNWAPVQQYLDRIRKARRMLSAPSEVIFVLAALDVVQSPWDVAHWIFWPSATYYSTADRVTAIALHQPRLIVTKVPWIGSREHRWIVNAVQEKYYYVHILGKWYPTDFQPLETKKRALRSSGAIEDRLDMTINQFFNIVDDGLPPSKRQRRPTRKIAETQPIAEEKRPRAVASRKNTIIRPPEPVASHENGATSIGDMPANAATPRSSRCSKPQVSPPPAVDVTQSPTDSESNPIDSFPSDLSSTSSHLRNRSTSQSSEKTVVAEVQRSVSVESATTAVAPSKKRKADALEETVEEESNRKQHEESTPTEGMITRSRLKSARISGPGADAKKPPTQSPTAKRAKPTPKAKSRKSRS